MNTIPFLQQVAQHYKDVQCLEDYCFVFPNRRSGQFFTHYLQRELIATKQAMTHLMPCVTSINDLVAEFTPKETATEIDMLFALYDAYCNAMKDNAQAFDRFIYWAPLIISDFNDIDKSLADAGQVYKNLESLYCLSSNYVNKEVEQKVKELFGDSLFTAFFDTSAEANLWRQRQKSGSEEAPDGIVKQEFIILWNKLAEIYGNFHELLGEKDLVSPGKQLRSLAEDTPENIPYKRLVFVAFGMLSAAEVKLFDNFMKAGLADFWWDNAGLSYLLNKAPNDPGALLVKGYCEHFQAPQIQEIQGFTEDINVVAVPSGVGQAKVAGSMVNNENANIKTAIVLPDENLLVPLLHSMDGINHLNVTLGYPLRNSGIVSLMHIVSHMHNMASKEKGEWSYYREDVYNILSHPIIKRFFTNEALAVLSQLSETNRFRVPEREFRNLSFKCLFRPAIDSESSKDATTQQNEFIDNLLEFCNKLAGKMKGAVPVPDDTEDDAPESDDDKMDVVMSLEQAFLAMYIDVLSQLKYALSSHNQTLQLNSVFYFIDRLASSATVPFSGEPLRGLQIMGLLETRGLDFEDLVIMSANEDTLPRHRNISSFIPNYIRRAYGMSTTEQQEAIMAYNFFRLLNRAGKVTLIYDSSVQETSTGEPSRYITQLEKIYGLKLKHVEMTTQVNTSSPLTVTVPNDVTVRDKYIQDPNDVDPVERYRVYLSASAINKYIACPLQFYMHYVQGLNEDNEVSDFMDYSVFGSIVHATLMDCYGRGGVFKKTDIEEFRNNKLKGWVVFNIKKYALHKKAPDNKPLVGQEYMLIDTIADYVRFVLEHDIKLAEKHGMITIKECEKKHNLPNLEIGGVHFNFTYMPDRIDCIGDVIRIVDYKTGGDPTTFGGVSELFDRNKGHSRCKAILQLLLYCYAYVKEQEALGRDVTSIKVQPVIYKIKSMKDSGVFMGDSTDNFVFQMGDAVATEFIKEMGATITDIFDKEYVQVPTAKTNDVCIHCRFVEFCRRIPIEW